MTASSWARPGISLNDWHLQGANTVVDQLSDGVGGGGSKGVVSTVGSGRVVGGVGGVSGR
jgi:hypothetical protein